MSVIRSFNPSTKFRPDPVGKCAKQGNGKQFESGRDQDSVKHNCLCHVDVLGGVDQHERVAADGHLVGEVLDGDADGSRGAGGPHGRQVARVLARRGGAVERR